MNPRSEAYLMQFLRLGEHSLGNLVLLYLTTVAVKTSDAVLAGLFSLLAALVLLFWMTGEALLIGGIVAVSIAIGAVIVLRSITRR
jgi:hypothetical protein